MQCDASVAPLCRETNVRISETWLEGGSGRVWWRNDGLLSRKETMSGTVVYAAGRCAAQLGTAGPGR